MAIMRTLKEGFEAVTTHPKFRPVALSSFVIIAVVGTIFAIVYRAQISSYFQNVFANPIEHMNGVYLIIGGVVLTTTGTLFGIKWLCQKYFF